MNKTVLIIDNDEAFVESLKRALTHDDFNVLVATDGLTGLQVARDRQPDLVLANTEMPRCNGWIISRMLKFDANCQHLTIVLLSPTDAELALAKSVGASDLWLRSMSIPAITERISTMLGLPRIVRPETIILEDQPRPYPSLEDIRMMEHEHA